MKRQKSGSKIFKIIKLTRIAVPVLGTAILFFACKQNDLEKIKAFSSPENLPIMEAENFKTFYTDSGIVRFSLEAKELLRYENGGKEYTEFPKGVFIVKYDAGGKVTSTLKADYAKQFEKEDKWEAKNNVVVTNEKGDTLKTELLIWEEKKQKIYTDEFVKIISEDKIITGKGLVSDQNMENLDIKKPEGFIYVSAKNNGEGEPASKKIKEGDNKGNTPRIKKELAKPLKLE